MYQCIQAEGSTSDFICLRKQGLPVSGTPLQSEHSPSGFHSFGLPPSSRDLGCYLSRRLAGSPPRPSSLVTTSGAAFKDVRPGRIYSKQKEIRAGLSARYPVSRKAITFGLRGSLAPRVQITGDSSTCLGGRVV